MPTTRRRHFVTETDELSQALDEAALRWPELSRAQVLARLAIEGHRVRRQAWAERSEQRRDALRRHSGALTGAYAPGELEALRQEWPL